MSCLILTPKIRELANKFPNETEESILNLVGLWQESNNKSIEDIPQGWELNDFIKKVRGNDAAQQLDEALSSSFDTPATTYLQTQEKVDSLFDPKTRRDRVSLIARLFSNEVDSTFESTVSDLQSSISNSEGADKKSLQEDLDNLTRLKVIELEKPRGIFEKVLNIFKTYTNLTEEGRIQKELDEINATKASSRYSDEQKLEAAKKRATYKYQEYSKVANDKEVFIALAEEASTILMFTEGIRLDPNYVAPADVNFNNGDPDGFSASDEYADDANKEESYKDGWMVNFRHTSSHESLSQAVRKVIMQIPRLDYRGKYEKDDLGFVRYLDADYVHATLIDKLRNMIDSDDMIPLLQESEKLKPWVKQITKLLQKDETLFSQFYQDFRKDFVSYWIQKKKLQPDGTLKMETISVNTPEGIYYLLDSWRDNYESGAKLDNDSVYDEKGEISKSNAQIGLDIVTDLNNSLQNLNTEERLQLIATEEVWDKLMKVLHMIGIDANPSVLRIALNDIKSSPGIVFTDPIMLLLPNLNVIFKGIIQGKIKSETLEDGTVKRGDLINTFGSAYNKIAEMLAEVTEDAIESSVRENDKSYYSHTTPNYLGKLIKNLKNVMRDGKRFERFLQDEFKQYEWFFKDGYWRNDWLAQLEASEDMRRGLAHKVVLNSDKVDYTDWDDLDYTLALLAEYWGDPESEKSSVKYTWYHVPILSDSPSAEFIRFRKYTTGDVLDENGKKRTYDDVILDKMVDIVNQEYDRIMLVRERDEKYQNGDASVEPIANYDIIRDENGEIKKLGGAEFKFFPYLNTYKSVDGKSFIDKVAELKNAGSGNELRTFIREVLNDMMEEGFEQTYKDWQRVGLLDELPNGRYKYLSIRFKEGQSKQNAMTATVLKKAREALGSSWTTNMELLLRDYSNNSVINTKNATTLMEQMKTLLLEKVSRGEMTMQEAQSISKGLFFKNNAKDALREYYWNSKLATSQIIQLTTTDLAFYANVEDFQKRYKEVHAPALRMNTKATYKGERIGREFEKTILIKDEEIISSALEDIKAVLDEKVKKGEMSKLDRDNIVNKFKKVNIADAQAYRSLSSYRAMLGMSGQWTDAMEQAYDNFKSDTWDISDFNIIWQTKKPFLYTQVGKNSGIQEHTDIKVPIQHKNSEFLLLAMHELVAGNLGKSSKLKAINKFMEDKQIDVVQFESTTKVGKQGVIDLSDVKSEKDVITRLEEATGIATGNENPNIVHKVPYVDYGIQTATPEHAIDSFQLVGTQIRKLITADISDGTIIDVSGVKKTKKEWLKLYNEINTENIIESFSAVNKIFQDPKEIERILLEEIRGNQRYSKDMRVAVTLDKDGNFNIPLFDPVISQMVQTLLNSVIKKNITKQKIKGGALIQVSDYGLTDDLKIVFEGEGENKRIKYLECYMPAYSKDFYEPLMDPETHVLDINKKDANGNYIFPEELRKAVGYRVPTEDKYSMVPLYIKGFLPQQNGSAIMLPAEITTLSGSDFDVDKLYIMLPEFNIKRYNMKQARQDFAKVNAIFNKVMATFTNSQLAEDILNEDTNDFKEWFAENKDKYKLSTPIISKVKYNHDKSAKDNGLRARNNLLIDMMYGVLTNADTASKILNPGGFDYQKQAARIATILDATYEDNLRKLLSEGGVKLERGQKVVSYLFTLPLDLSYEEKESRRNNGQPFISLNELAERTKVKMDPLSPRTQVLLHQQNMTGAKLISIYANHNANHALIQHTELALSKEHGAFTLNGKELTSLHDITNSNKEFISRNNAGFLAASVDNVKDPVLAALNQNLFTADASMLLSRLGYTPVEIGLLMMQPIVQEITQTYFRESRVGKSKDDIIKQVIKEYKKIADVNKDITYNGKKEDMFLLEDLAENIMLAKEATADRHETSDMRKIEFYQKQVAVGYLFKRIMSDSEALSQVVQATRSDTPNGAAGPTIADSEIKMQKVTDLIQEIETNPKFPLVKARVIFDNIADGLFDGTTNIETDINKLRERLLESPLPFLQAFYTLGVQQSERLLGPYFPQFTKPFRDVIETLRGMTRRGKLDVKTMNNVYNDLLAYIMSKTGFFGTDLALGVDSTSEKTVTTSREKRADFINNFPKYFKKVISENEDIAELEFIKRLKVIKANNHNPVATLVFKNVGQLSPTLRERYMRDWASLLYMNNPEAQKLALNLFRYSFYRNGFAFGPNTFIHLAPVAVRKAVPEYISTLRNLLTESDDYSEFVYQYIYNHLDNRKLVPGIPETSTTKFQDENKDILDTVTFTIDKTSSSDDKKIVRRQDQIQEDTIYEFFEFIGRRIRGNWVYYTLDSKQSTSNTAVYTRIEPLGFRNSFIEYEYGKKVEEMKSVIAKNDVNYDPYGDTKVHFNDGSYTLSEPAPALPEGYLESIPNLPAEAYKMKYNDSLPEATPVDNDMLSLAPAKDWKDAENKPTCITIGII